MLSRLGKVNAERLWDGQLFERVHQKVVRHARHVVCHDPCFWRVRILLWHLGEKAFLDGGFVGRGAQIVQACLHHGAKHLLYLLVLCVFEWVVVDIVVVPLFQTFQGIVYLAGKAEGV